MSLELQTERLVVVAETLDIARAAAQGREALGACLNATVPEAWPPELLADAIGFWIPRLEAEPHILGWTGWHIVRKKPRTVIGVAGFKGPPKDSRVDIGYGILDEFQRRGYSTEAVTAMVEWAFADRRGNRIVGETLPDLLPSICVMKRVGFRRVGMVETGHGGEENVLQYELTREGFDLF